MSRRGDVVVVEIPFYDRPGGKERPAVVVQCDRNNGRLISTVVAGMATNLRHDWRRTDNNFGGLK
jgi:mRNA-degrading endonuclease toxin of MazEF toxin-antitoxin module